MTYSDRVTAGAVHNSLISYALVRSCRWVSRVVEDVPYVTHPDVFEKYNVGVCALAFTEEPTLNSAV